MGAQVATGGTLLKGIGAAAQAASPVVKKVGATGAQVAVITGQQGVKALGATAGVGLKAGKVGAQALSQGVVAVVEHREDIANAVRQSAKFSAKSTVKAGQATVGCMGQCWNNAPRDTWLRIWSSVSFLSSLKRSRKSMG